MINPRDIFHLTLLFLFIASAVMMVIFYLRARKLIVADFKKQLEYQYETLFTADVFNSENVIDEGKYSSNIKTSFIYKILFNQKRVKREVLLSLLTRMHRNLSGSTGEKISKLYYQLGFINHSYRKLKSRFWEVKIKGIRELTEMNITDAIKNIMPFINDPNVVLRTEAQMAVIRLSPVNDISFLNNFTASLSTWEQIHILSAILEKNLDMAPDFAHFLKSQNKSLVLFAIKMTDHLKQQKAIPDLKELLKDNDPEVRNCVIHALANLDATEAVSDILVLYSAEEKNTQLEIIRAIGKIGSSENEMDFLENQLNNPDHEISLSASYALKTSGSSGKLLLRKIKHNSNGKLAAIIEHSLDERII